MGVPAQRTSMPVVWPLHRGVSRHTSASWPLLTCSSLGATGEKMMREPGTPMFWAYCWMLGSPTAGKRRSHRTLLGTRFRICRERVVLKPIFHTKEHSKKWHNQVYPTYISPHLKSRGVNLIQLVKVAVDNGVFWETILGAGCHNDCAWHLLPCGSFVVDLKWWTKPYCLRDGGASMVSSWRVMKCDRSRPFEPLGWYWAYCWEHAVWEAKI